MTSNDDKARAAIADQAGTWFVANDEGTLDAHDAAALTAWLKASPAHIGEFLGVAVTAGDLKALAGDPEYTLQAVVGQARAADASTVRALSPGAVVPERRSPLQGWLAAAAVLAGVGILSLGVLRLWNTTPSAPAAAPAGSVTLHLETGHGEQLARELPDGSLVHLDTDSALSIRYGPTERLVMLTAGQAHFQIAHERERAFRVLAGPAEIVDLGTQFDVRLEPGATVVTVIAGRVAVAPAATSTGRSPRFVQLGPDQQTRLSAGAWPSAVRSVDAQAATAWLHRQIVFDHEPLERVAAEFNRYGPKPFEIVTPALRSLEISGVFATDNPDAFIAFLRSLKGVQVEVTATKIRVSQK